MAKLIDDQERRIPTEYSDFGYAMKACGEPPPFTKDEVHHLAACYPGEADGDEWVWIIQCGTKRFYAMTAWCDYTGWGCQDGRTVYGPFDSEDAALVGLRSAELDDAILRNLEGQLTGRQPYALK